MIMIQKGGMKTEISSVGVLPSGRSMYNSFNTNFWLYTFISTQPATASMPGDLIQTVILARPRHTPFKLGVGLGRRSTNLNDLPEL